MNEHNRHTYKIAVAEKAVILRSGIIEALKRAMDCNLHFIEIESSSDFDRIIRSYCPDLLIINPYFGGLFDIETFRNKTNIKIFALLSTVTDPTITEKYDNTIELFDNEQTLHRMIDKSMGYDQQHESKDNEELLTIREKDILSELVKGYSNKEIAQHLSLSIHTVLTHRRNIIKKLQIHSLSGLTIYAVANKIVSIEEITQ